MFAGGSVLIPGPDTRVVELRVHGVQGTTPQSLVDAVAAVDVAGDGLGRVVRPADRLRRPAPGPVLQAAGRPVTRVVEGYVWGAMTSGGWAKATWALLFPFSLANVAHWMLPPVPSGSVPAHLLGIALRALLRLAALLLTVLLIAQLEVISLDLVATQCLAPTATCLWGPSWLSTTPWVRAVVGLAPIALAVFVLHRMSSVDWRIERKEVPAAEGGRSGLPGAHVATDPDTPALRVLHVVAGLGAAVVIALGGPAGPLLAPGWHGGAITACWALGVALVAVSALGAMLLDDPTGGAPHRGGRWLRAALGPRPRRVLHAVAWVSLLVAVALLDRLPVRLPGADLAVQMVAALVALVCVLIALLLVPAALLARRAWSAQPRELRPWAGGWMAAPVVAVAALLGGGFGAGIALSVRQVLGHGDLPRGYDYIALLWGVAGVLAFLAGVAMAVTTGMMRWSSLRRDKEWAREASLLHAGRARDAKRAARAWWWARWQRRHSHHVVLIMSTVLAVGAVPSAFLRLREVDPPTWARPVVGLGVAVLAVLALSLLRAVYLAARRPDKARQVGVLADLAAFWPREAHPVVPPCYALKVVPELVARVREHLADPGTRVVLAGHSQGSLLAAVAAARLLEELPPAQAERVGLVTAGSQLQWAYPRAFPAVVPHSSLESLAGGLAGRWRALCRGTDALGGAVMTWDRQVFDGMLLGAGFRPDGTSGALPPALRGPTGALVLGGDHWLPDPQRGPFPGRRWAPGVNRHADYTSDPEWDRAIAIAAGLETTDPPAAPVLPTARQAPLRSPSPSPETQ
ncbi:membrane protein [Saccharothrix sp. NRRL B-16348]|nr:membrane protein [Saccharothrix sp. NRRL B-16348]